MDCLSFTRTIASATINPLLFRREGCINVSDRTGASRVCLAEGARSISTGSCSKFPS